MPKLLAAALLLASTSLTLAADWNYRGKAWLSVDNRANLSQDAYTLVGLYGVWDSADAKWQARAGVRNLTDEVYKTDGQEFSSVGNIQTVYYGDPRTWQVRHLFIALATLSPPPESPTQTTYFSVSPYKFGEGNAKFRVAPDPDNCPVCCRRSAAGLGMAFIGIVLLNPRTWMCGLLRGIRIMRREGIASRTKRRRGDGRMAGPRGTTRQHGAACEASLRRSQPDQVRRVCLNHRPGRRYPRFGAN